MPEEASRLWLGELAEINSLYCRVWPLAELVDGKWVRLTAERVEFPSDGYLRGGRAQFLEPRQPGSVWVFGRRPSGGAKDHWAVDAPERPKPVLDLSDLTVQEARQRLIDTGVTLPGHQSR